MIRLVRPERGRVLFWVLGGLILLLGLYCCELVPVRTPPVWTQEADNNPYLALGQFLQRQGYQVEYAPLLADVPTQHGTLFFSHPPDIRQSAELRRWVQQGNHLLLPAPYLGVNAESAAVENTEEGQQDALLSPLGVYLHDRRFEEDDIGGGNKDHRLLLAVGAGWLECTFDDNLHLEDSKELAVDQYADSNGIHVLDYEVGKGHLTVFSETALFDNHQLEDKDNAALLLWLIGEPPHADSRVWIIYEGVQPGLLGRLLQRAWPLLVALALLLLAIIWQGNSRFGPLLPSPVQPRRSLAEHLLAAGRYLWHAGEQQRLYSPLRQSVRQQCFRRYPHWRRLEDAALLAELQTVTQISIPQLQQALFAPPDQDLVRFLADMRVLHHLRKTL